MPLCPKVIHLLLLTPVIAASVGEPLTIDNFRATVLSDKRVWAVEVASEYCGSCQEFAPEWKKVEDRFRNTVKFGQVIIEDEKAMSLAEELGVLDAGIPSVLIFDGANEQGTSFVSGELKTSSILVKELESHFTQFAKDDDGFHLKQKKGGTGDL